MTTANDRRRSTLRQPAVLAWLRLARLYHKIDTASARLFREHGLSTAQFDVLAQIGTAGGISQQELAESLLVTKGNVSQLIERMERQGIVERCQAGRTKFLYLTPRGMELYNTVVIRQEEHIAELFAALSHTEQDQLLALLRKLDRSLG